MEFVVSPTGCSENNPQLFNKNANNPNLILSEKSQNIYSN